MAGVAGELDHDGDHGERQPRAGADGDHQTRGGDGAMGGTWDHPIE